MLYYFAERTSFFCSKSESDRITIFQCEFLQFLFSTNVNCCFDTTDWKNCKMTKKLLNLEKWHQKEKKLFGKGNLFSSTYSSESAISCYKNPEKMLSTKGPTFFISKSEEGWYIVQFFKKLLNLRIFERYAGCSFGNHAGSFSLKVQKKFRSKRWNKRIVTFFFRNKIFLSLLLETFFALLSTRKLIFSCCHGKLH